MADQSSEEKTEKATLKKRQDTRKKGEVAKSRELPSVAVLLASLLTFVFFGAYMYSHIKMIMVSSFSLPLSREINVLEFINFAQEVIISFLVSLGPLLAFIVITAIFSNIMQVGFMVSTESITPKLSKLDPIKGFGRLFSKQSIMELFKTLVKLFIVSGIGYLTIRNEMRNIYQLGDMEINSIVVYVLGTTFKLFIRCTLAMIVLVVIDYAFQKYEFESKLKMTKQEVRDEQKNTEGDPQVKSRIRSIQAEMARKRMMQDVPKADVVITNPTRLAIAIKYDESAMNAPKLIAKGAGEIAKKIREIAQKHDIPIVENKELARSMYSQVEIDQEVPASLYQAVAEVLAYIYKLKLKK